MRWKWGAAMGPKAGDPSPLSLTIARLMWAARSQMVLKKQLPPLTNLAKGIELLQEGEEGSSTQDEAQISEQGKDFLCMHIISHKVVKVKEQGVVDAEESEEGLVGAEPSCGDDAQ